MKDSSDHDFSLISSDIKIFRSRLKVVWTFFLVLFLGLIGRLFWVSFGAHWASKTTFLAFPGRADIVDRKGILLASSLSLFSLYAHPNQVINKKETARQLCRALPFLSFTQVLKCFESDKNFVWVARHLTPEEKMNVHSLGLQGIFWTKEQKRFYPQDRLFCHVLGLTDVDQQGVAGIEKRFDQRLVKSRDPLVLSLDTSLQHIVYEELNKGLKEFSAVGGSGLLVNMKTGEILSMVSLPSFSPSHLDHKESKNLFNRNVSGVYEFGSIMKIVNTALVLESGVATLRTVFDASAPLKIGRFKITDFRGKNRPLTVREAFLYSSNIAHGKMALAAGPERQMSFFKKLGFLNPIQLELPEQAFPLVPKRWSKFQNITAAYGYGFAVTPLHIAQGIQSLIVGHRVPLTLLKKDSKEHVLTNYPAIVSKPTSKDLVGIMGEAVVEGQAKKAMAQNCRVGAKTGTANLNTRGRYFQKENFTSCVVIFPLEDPTYLLLVCLEKPKPSAKTHFYATAGWIVAPIASSIVDAIVPLLGLLKNHNEDLFPFQKKASGTFSNPNMPVDPLPRGKKR